MDGMEVMGSQPHPAAASPFILSSPPLGHHHATYNIQSVQLSFDCLAYNVNPSRPPPVNTPVAPVKSLSIGVPVQQQLSQQQQTVDNSEERLRTRVQHRLRRPETPASSSPRNQTPEIRPENSERDLNHRQNLTELVEKDKTGDLNTPVTTSGDLPSFFGPSALVEPPPISGTCAYANHNRFFTFFPFGFSNHWYNCHQRYSEGIKDLTHL